MIHITFRSFESFSQYFNRKCSKEKRWSESWQTVKRLVDEKRVERPLKNIVQEWRYWHNSNCKIYSCQITHIWSLTGKRSFDCDKSSQCQIVQYQNSKANNGVRRQQYYDFIVFHSWWSVEGAVGNSTGVRPSWKVHSEIDVTIVNDIDTFAEQRYDWGSKN